MVYATIARILISLLGPFAKGALGSLINFALIVGIVVFGAYVLLDVNLVVIGFEVAVMLFDSLIDAIVDSATS
jgi:hypothetical protein